MVFAIHWSERSLLCAYFGSPSVFWAWTLLLLEVVGGEGGGKAVQQATDFYHTRISHHQPVDWSQTDW